MRRLLHPSHGGVPALPKVPEETKAQKVGDPDRRQARLRTVLEEVVPRGRQAARAETRKRLVAGTSAGTKEGRVNFRESLRFRGVR